MMTVSDFAHFKSEKVRHIIKIKFLSLLKCFIQENIKYSILEDELFNIFSIASNNVKVSPTSDPSCENMLSSEFGLFLMCIMLTIVQKL